MRVRNFGPSPQRPTIPHSTVKLDGKKSVTKGVATGGTEDQAVFEVFQAIKNSIGASVAILFMVISVLLVFLNKQPISLRHATFHLMSQSQLLRIFEFSPT